MSGTSTHADTALADGPGPGPAADAPASGAAAVRDLAGTIPARRIGWAAGGPRCKRSTAASFDVARGETLSLVGESGCGKTTTGKSILRLIEPTSGSAGMLDGEDVALAGRRACASGGAICRSFSRIPHASLNPRMTAGAIVAEPMRNFSHARGHGARERAERVAWLFSKVGLRPEAMKKFPHEFSGGQRQRLGIARALALQPTLIVCDEPVSALDVSVQAQVINLLMDLQKEFGIAYLFVAHDLAVVRHISHRVAVMYLGQLVELADRDTLFAQPRHPYTEILLSAVPVPNPARAASACCCAGIRPARPTRPAAAASIRVVPWPRIFASASGRS